MKMRWYLAPLSLLGPILYFFLIAPLTLHWAFPANDAGLLAATYSARTIAPVMPKPKPVVPAQANPRQEARPAHADPKDDPFAKYANATAARAYMTGGASLLLVMAALATLAASYSIYLSLFFACGFRRTRIVVIVAATIIGCYTVGVPLSISEGTMRTIGAPEWLQAACAGTEDASDHIRERLLTQIVLPAEKDVLGRGTESGISALLEIVTYFGFSATLSIFVALACLALPLHRQRHAAEVYRAQLNEFVWLAVLSAGILVSGVYTQLQLFETVVSLAPAAFHASLEGMVASLVTLWAANATVALMLSSLPAFISWGAGTYRLAVAENPQSSIEARKGWMKERGLDFSLQRIVALILSILAPLVTGPILHALAGGIG